MERKEKVAVFFDVQNLYHSAKSFCNGKVSYKHLMDEIKRDREVVFARAYAAHRDAKESRLFYDALDAAGISVKTKRVQVKRDNKDFKVIPVHFEVEIATDACYIPEDVTTVVFCTGNGNFAYLAAELAKDGLNVEFWSFSESTSKDIISGNSWKFVQIPTECLLTKKIEEPVNG